MRDPVKNDLSSQIERLKRRLRGSVAPIEKSTAQALYASDFSPQSSSQPPKESEHRPGAFVDTAAAFHALVEGIREGAAILAHDRTVLTCNRRLAEMLKLECEAVMGRSLLEFIPSEDRARFEELLRSAPEEFTKLRMRLSGANAFPLPVELVVKSLTLGDRLVYSLLATDLSRRRRAEEQLSFQARLLENVSDAVLGMDGHFRITYWNAAAERLYGWTADEVTRRTLSEVVQSELTAEEQRELDAQLAETGSYDNEVWQRRKDGSVIRVESRRIALRDPDGKMTGYVAVNRDISERKRSEASLREALSQIQNLNKELELRVMERTSSLELANQELHKEIAQRQSEILAREETEGKLRDVLRSLEDTMLAAREREELLRIAIEAAGMVAWTYDPEKDKVVTFARTAEWLEILPEKSFSLFGRGLELVHPDDRVKVTEALPRVLAGESYSLELRLISPDGTLHWIATHGRLMTGASGKGPFLVGVTQDISERRQAQEHLHQLNRELENRTREVDAERARWQGVVEGIAEEVWVADAQGRMSLINLPDATAMGLTEFTGKTVAQVYDEVDILYPDSRPRPPEEAPLFYALKGQVVRGEEIMRHRQSGRTRYRQFSAAPTRNATGEITGAVAIVRDITDHKELQLALQQTSRRVQEILESIQDGFFALNRDWCFTYVNQRAAQGVGIVPETLIGQNLWETFPALLGTPLEEHYRTAMTRRVPARFESSGVMTGSSYEVRVYPSADGISVYWIDITERKQAEQRLRESEEQLRVAAQAASIGIWNWNPQTGEVRVSANWKVVFGVSPDTQVTFETWRNALHPDDREAAVNALIRAAEMHAEYNVEYRVIWQNGTIRWLVDRGRGTYDENGRPLNFAGVNVDITERKHAEEELRKSEERFRTLANNISQFAWMADASGGIFWFNQRWFEYTGTTLQEMQGWGWQKVHHPDHVARVVEKIKRSFERGEVWEDTFPLRSRTGEYRWFLSRAIPLRDAEGQITRWFGTNTDITEYLQTQEKLRLSEERFRTALKNAPITVYNLDLNLHYTWAFDPHGQRSTDLRGKQAEQTIPKLGPELKAIKRTVLASGIGTRQEVTAQGPDGRRHVYDLTIDPLRNETNAIIGVTCAAIDITEHKQAAVRIQELNQELEHRATQLEIANKELESFSYSVSHDLRTPLATIDGFAKMLDKDYGSHLPAEGRHYIDLIRGGTRQMEELIQSLLALSRLSRQAVHRKPVNMTRLVAEAFEAVHQGPKRQDLTFILDDLPEDDADPILLKQVWINLIANALKFTRDSGNARIEIGCEPCDGEERVYYVRDNGVGFDMAQADKLFGVFQRLHGEDEYEGTGIGLAIVQRIVHRHGGRVWAEGKVGKGATFFFTLNGRH